MPETTLTPDQLAAAIREAREYILVLDASPGSRIDALRGAGHVIVEISRLLPKEEREAFRSACRRS